ncbi:MAG: FadR family transcriptional regulator [Pseudomonadales bacterium]|nr:FadR family transcriptional regulator [Pseudomonadales bacterium]
MSEEVNHNATITRAEEITAILRDEILTGQYRPGERLPSERELAARFESNRGAVRESLKKLEEIGIASIKPGGVRVVPLEEATLSVLAPMLDLQSGQDCSLFCHTLEVTGALIGLSARSAVTQATREQLSAMIGCVERMLASPSDPDLQSDAWRTLARMLTEINNNLVLRLIMNGLRLQFESRQKPGGPPLQLDISEQQTILSALKDSLATRNADQVASCINQHFDLLRTTLEDYYAADPQNRSQANV